MPEFPTATVPAPGRMNVDFEERVDFARLRAYRLARARAALEASDVGALLLFDMNNIRYVTSTTIGEWARDKIARFTLLTRGGEPHLWDFGSAAKKNRLHAPWLEDDHIRGGMTGLRGAVAPRGRACSRASPRRSPTSCARRAWPTCPSAWTSSSCPCSFELQAAGITVADGQQVMLDAREIKSPDEIMLLSAPRRPWSTASTR